MLDEVEPRQTDPAIRLAAYQREDVVTHKLLGVVGAVLLSFLGAAWLSLSGRIDDRADAIQADARGQVQEAKHDVAALRTEMSGSTTRIESKIDKLTDVMLQQRQRPEWRAPAAAVAGGRQ